MWIQVGLAFGRAGEGDSALAGWVLLALTLRTVPTMPTGRQMLAEPE